MYVDEVRAMMPREKSKLEDMKSLIEDVAKQGFYYVVFGKEYEEEAKWFLDQGFIVYTEERKRPGVNVINAEPCIVIRW